MFSSLSERIDISEIGPIVAGGAKAYNGTELEQFSVKIFTERR